MKRNAIRHMTLAAILGLWAAAPVTAGTITINSFSVGSNPIPGGIRANPGSSGNLSWGELTVVYNSATSAIEFDGSFECATALCNSGYTFTFHYTGSGFSPGDPVTTVFSGFTTGPATFSGALQGNVSGVGALPPASLTNVNGPFWASGNAVALTTPNFTGNGQLFIRSLSGGGTLHVTSNGADIVFTPEPGTGLLVGGVGGALLLYTRRKRQVRTRG